MPYITKDERANLDEPLKNLIFRIHSLGQLNYCITKLISGENIRNFHYDDFVILLGTLEAVKLELYAAVVRPYEITKRDKNGDVY